ncbi:NAD(P)-dependent alcohol dehydrogenase [Myxococcaceae bacterium GXIMD 01537]
MGSMKRWELDGFGKNRLALRRTEIPEPGPRELLIRVSAVSLNYRDKLIVENGMGMTLAFPFTPASDVAGVVAAVGPGTQRVGVGERVIGTFLTHWTDGAIPSGEHGPVQSMGGPLPGVLAEYVVLPEDSVVRSPASLDDDEASTLPCAALTAWMTLVETGNLRAGQTIVTQGTGGVSLFAVQLAAARGAQVIVTSSSDDKLARARALGATHGINRARVPDWGRAVRELTGGRGADHVLEMAGGDNLAQSLEALATGGRLSVIGILDGIEGRLPLIPVIQRRITIQGQLVGHRRALEDLVRAIDERPLKPVIEERYAFEDLPAALRHLDRGPFGKLVVRVAA